MYRCRGYNSNKITVVAALMDLTIKKREFVKRKLQLKKDDGFHQKCGGAVPKRRKRYQNLVVRVRACFIEEAS